MDKVVLGNPTLGSGASRGRRTSQAALALSYILGLVIVTLWVRVTGPHVDTVFEYDRLYRSASLADLLQLLAQDNQPPLAGTLFWVAYRVVGGDLGLLRVLAGAITFTGIVAVGTLTIRWWHRRADVEGRSPGQVNWVLRAAVFVLLVAVSPGIGTTLVMVRYSSILVAVWLGASSMLLATLTSLGRRPAFSLGVLLGVATLISFSSVALWVFVLCALRRKLRLLPWVAVGALPGVIATAAWTLWAGGQFAGRVATKPVDSLRSAVATAWELVTWPVLGPASQPSIPTLMLLALGLAPLCWIYLRTPRGSQKPLNLALMGFWVAMATYILVALNNGSMSGPTAFTILAFVLAAPVREGSRLWIALATFGLATASATVLTWQRVDVLRPMHFSSASDEVRKWVENEAAQRTPTLFLDGAEFGAVLHPGLTSAKPAIVNYTDIDALVEEVNRVIVIRGDDRNATQRNEAWRIAQDQLAVQGFRLSNSVPFGRYSGIGTRQVLSLYNTQDSQFVAHIFEKVGSSPTTQ